MSKETVNYEELQLENYRVLARKGMGTESKKDARVGLELDFYEPKRGDKRSGKITKMTRDGYEVQDEKDRKKYKFKFFDPKNYKKLMQQQEEMSKEQDHESALQMNAYMNTLSRDRSVNLWNEAKQGEDPEPVSGKKTFTKKPQENVVINPEEG